MLDAYRAKHAMISFSDARDIYDACEVCQSVAIDNGTFHAWVQGLKYDFEGYLEFAAKWICHPCVDWVVIPDVIDGDAVTNDRLIERWQLPHSKSVPVYHLHEPIARLQWMIRQDKWPCIALGSSGDYRDPGSPIWWARMAEVMSHACHDEGEREGMPRYNFHGMRMLDPDITSHIPLHSGDSTNVARNSGIDKAWGGPYAPPSIAARAMVMMLRVEHHATARRWCKSGGGIQRNLELIG